MQLCRKKLTKLYTQIQNRIFPHLIREYDLFEEKKICTKFEN